MTAFLTPRLRAEARANLQLAMPLMAAQLSFVGMTSADTIMAGRLGALPLAAVAVGTNIWFLVFVLFLGTFMAVSPIVAHRVGAGRAPSETGALLRNTLLLAVLLGLVWMLLLNLIAAPALDLLHLDTPTRDLAERYLHAISLAPVGMCLCFVMRNGCEGHGVARVPVIAGVVALTTNVLANLPLMYGVGDWPGLGAVGSAYGTVIAAWCMAATYALAYAVEPRLRALRLFAARPRLSRETVEVLRLGLPIAATVVAESWLFSLGALLVAHFGAGVVAAHQIAITFASLVFMVPLSIGFATTVRVGQAAGALDAPEAALRGRVGIGLGALFALSSAAGMALLARQVVALYTDAPEVAGLAERFLMFAAVFQLFDCVQATANGALRGLKDTRWPMAVTVGAYWLVGLPVAALLVLVTPIGPVGVWCGFIAGLAVAAAGLTTRFLRRTRRAAETGNASLLMP